MPTYNIRGINVDFPFEAYDCQIVYMEKVIQSLQDRCNALLESPTGTGKTLCLLCATLAWRKSLGSFSTSKAPRSGMDGRGKQSEGSSSRPESSNFPTIIYTSRTHSQIRQVIQELKRTNYRPKMGVLGSREQLCIHEEVRLLHGKAQNNACHSLCRKRKKHFCRHYPRVSEFMKSNPGLGDEPIDIEDLVNIGESSGPCPYYVSRELHKIVDILFAPYNYLIDPSNRKSLSINWDNSVLIFDEAHNLESICAEAASFDLPSGVLTACIAEAKRCVDLSIARRDALNDKSCNPDNFAILRALLLKLHKRIAEVPIESKELGFTRPGPYIYELLGELNITDKTATMLIDTVEEAATLLEEEAKSTDSEEPQKTKEAKSTDSEEPQKTKGTVCRLETIGDILKIIFKENGNAHAEYYRVHVQEVESSAMDAFQGKASRTLSWWCFNPGLAMEAFFNMGVRSIILTSGTLSPMDSFAEELKLQFPIRLENPHVILPNQIWTGIIPVGPSGHPFNSSYRTRDSAEYKLELGNAIVNFARIVPDGLLVFFPSYYLLDLCIDFWKRMGHASSAHSNTIWERICKHKLPIIEPRQSSLFPSAIEDYMAKLKDTTFKGAVFFAVCRGKVSEGLDFADHAGRAVIITGIPFAMRNDPKVRLKRDFLDQQAFSQKTGPKVLNGEEWYSQQASRAVNQAVGRVIRHRHDYGAIIFCDERFTNANRQSQISLWIRPHIKCYSKFGDVVLTLTRFFRDAAILAPAKKEVIQIEDHRDRCSQKKIQSLDILPLGKILSPLSEAMDKSCSEESPSFLGEIKQEGICGQLRGVVPANRSNLHFYNPNRSLTLKPLSVVYHDKLPGKKYKQASKHQVIDLNGNALMDEETSEELITPYSSKKPKLSSPEQSHFGEHYEEGIVKKDLLGNPSVTDSMTHTRPSMFEIGSMQNVHDASSLLLKDDVTKRKGNTEFLSQKSRSDEVEKKGSAFLIQVREKLTDGEYKEFVGFMKALKSNAMKIGHALQAITRLFSAPDRLPLLLRFKDYVPAKYQSLYEQCLKKND